MHRSIIIIIICIAVGLNPIQYFIDKNNQTNMPICPFCELTIVMNAVEFCILAQSAETPSSKNYKTGRS